MDTLERFNAALTYIEANLDNEIDSKELSISATDVWTGRHSIYKIPMKK